MLGPDFGIGVTDPKSPSAVLLPEEESAIKGAVNKRRLEFAAGREAARRAMEDLDLTPGAIPMAADRSPLWPDGVVGSITHCNDICIATVARKASKHGIGIDIEPDRPLHPDLEEVICTPSERAWLDTQNIEQRGHLAKRTFCVKESIYKALYPLIGQVIGFQDVEILFPSLSDSPIVLTMRDRTTKLKFRHTSRALGNNIFCFAAIDNAAAESLRGLGGAS